MAKEKQRALIIVDVQNDFCSGGSLEVPNSDEIIPIINDLLTRFELVIFTKDWHPQNHKSFASQHDGKKVFDTIDLNGLPQVLWPDHCVQDTDGSEFHEGIDLSKVKKDFYIFKKGMDPEVDSYSGFYDNGHKNSTGLSKFLKSRNVSQVFISGLALDYCVKYTAIDSVNEGFTTVVIKDACKGIDLDPKNTYKEFDMNNIIYADSWSIYHLL